jgi:PLD-like domain
MLLESSVLSRRWVDLVAAASSIDTAVAWLTNKERVDDLVKFAALAGHRVRVIAGINDYNNAPDCLSRLHDAGLLKVVIRVCPLFYPKLYLFRLADRTVCWIGSANLTREGFGRNTELMHEHDDDGSAAAWFEQVWATQKPPGFEWLEQYQEACQNHPLTPPPRLPRLHEPLDPFKSWAGYVAALKLADRQWTLQSNGESGVFSGNTSHMSTILLAKPIIRKDWADLSTRERRILLVSGMKMALTLAISVLCRVRAPRRMCS